MQGITNVCYLNFFALNTQEDMQKKATGTIDKIRYDSGMLIISKNTPAVDLTKTNIKKAIMPNTKQQ